MSDLTDAVEEWTNQQARYRLFDDYYRGRHQLHFASRDFQDKYAQELLTDAVLAIRENLCPAAVTAFTDGISVKSWGSEELNQTADDVGITRLEAFVDRAGFKSGDAYAIVWPNAKGEKVPTFQRPETIVPRVDPDSPDQLQWAARLWIDRANYGRANIYYADRLERWRTKEPVRNRADEDAILPEWEQSWTPMDDADGDIVRHDFGAVPVCWWKRDPDDHLAHGNSILTDVIPLQDANNKSLADLIINSEAFSRPLYALMNFKKDQAPINPFAPEAQQKQHAGADEKFRPGDRQIITVDGQGPLTRFDPPDMTKVLQVQDAFAMKIARVIGVPGYWFSQTSGDVPSGESLRVLSTRRTSVIRAWQRDAEPVWRGLMQLMGLEPTIEWDDPMPLDPAEKVQIAQAKKQMGYSLEDVVAYLDESDPVGIVDRARQASESDAQAVGRTFMSGMNWES